MITSRQIKSKRAALLRAMLVVGLLLGVIDIANAQHLEITSSNPNPEVGDLTQLAAVGYNAQGNTFAPTGLTWSIHPPTGLSITQIIGNFCYVRADQPGDYAVTCVHRESGLSAEAQITVTGAKVVTMVLDPSNATLNVGGQQSFTTTGKDASGNEASILNPVWTTSGGGTNAPNGSQCTYTAITAGNSLNQLRQFLLRLAQC